MSWSNNLPWRDQEDLDHAEKLKERAGELRRDLIDRTVSINMAYRMGLGEEAIERLIDGIWDDTRKVALDPETVDIVLDLLFALIAPEAGRPLDAMLEMLYGGGDIDVDEI